MNKPDHLLSSLPFRVIVSKILPYYLFKRKGDDGRRIRTRPPERSPYELFGYFTFDPTRKIFMIFTSIRLHKWFKMYVDPTQLRHIIWSSPTNSSIKKFASMSTKMSNFFSMEIKGYFGEPLGDLFSDPKSFPNLSRLELRRFKINELDREIFKKSNIWKKLTSFRLFEDLFEEDDGDADFEPFSNLFSDPKNFPTLKVLELEILVLLKTKLHIEIPNLKKLKLELNDPETSFKNVSVDCKNLESVSVGIIHGKKEIQFLKDLVVLKSPRIQEVSVSTLFREDHDYSDYIPLDFLFTKEANTPFAIRKLSIEGSSDWEAWEARNNETFLCNMESLEIQSFSLEMSKHLGLPMKNLQNLDLNHCRFTEKGIYPLTNNIQHLRFNSVRGLKDHFFQKNSFPLLSSLVLTGSIKEGLDGKSWTEFPNLKSLKARSQKFKDSFFKKLLFPKLETLVLVSCSSLRGGGWNPQNFAFLKRLKIEGNSQDVPIKRKFLMNFLTTKRLKLDCLEELYLESCLHEFKPKKWKGVNSKLLENVRILSLKGCQGIGDFFFRSFEWTNLRELRLEDLNEERVKGEGWNFMENLVRLELLYGCEKLFEEDEGLPFNEKQVKIFRWEDDED